MATKYYKNILECTAVILLAAIPILQNLRISSPAQTTFSDNDLMALTLGEKKLVFDTGAEVTLLYTDTTPPHSLFSFNNTVTDIHGNASQYRKHLLLYADYTYFHRLLQPVICLPENLRILDFDGIIGADIINRANWHIDFERHQVKMNAPFPEGTPDFTLKYRIENGIFMTDLTADALNLKNLVFDSGYTRSDLFLTKDRISEPQCLEQSGKDSCISVSKEIQYIDVYRNPQCLINGASFKDLRIALSANRNCIGLPFLKRFSSVYIDTDQQKITCYY